MHIKNKKKTTLNREVKSKTKASSPHCHPKKIGYARVSTNDQNLALQIDALKSAGCKKIFCDQGVSGNIGARPGLTEALNFLRKDDELIVWRLDRLGRSLINLIRLLEDLGKKGISFRSLNENIDTSSSGGKLIFHLMAALAEFERALISERTKAGIVSAKARGKHVGRPPSLSQKQLLYAISMIEDNDLSVLEAAEKVNVSQRTLKRFIKHRKEGINFANKIEVKANDTLEKPKKIKDT